MSAPRRGSSAAGGYAEYLLSAVCLVIAPGRYDAPGSVRNSFIHPAVELPQTALMRWRVAEPYGVLPLTTGEVAH